MESEYKYKYLKYKQKYLQLCGGASVKEQTVDELIESLKHKSEYSKWKDNLVKYHEDNIKKIIKIVKEFEKKTSNTIEIDKINRLNTIELYRKESAVDDDGLNDAYIKAVKDGVNQPIKEYINSLKDVSVYSKIKKEFNELFQNIKAGNTLNSSLTESSAVIVSSDALIPIADILATTSAMSKPTPEAKHDILKDECYKINSDNVMLTKDILEGWIADINLAKNICKENLPSTKIKVKRPIEFSRENRKKIENLKETIITPTTTPYTINKFIKEFLNVLLNFTQLNLALGDAHTIRADIVEILLKKYNACIDFLSQQHGGEKFCFETYIDNFCELCTRNKENIALIPFIKKLIEFMKSIFLGNINVIPPFNIIISGNPGIGKSYVAQKIGELINASGLLPKGTMFNIKKPDVLGQHIGETAPKTYSILRQGIGNVIFIDEAYSFAGENRPSQGFDPFGLEFLNALTDFLTEHIGLLCVVAAGYKKEMSTQFLDTNPGLSRRFSVKINLERYTTKYLKDEFIKRLNESISSDIKQFFSYYTNAYNDLKDIINLFDLQLEKSGEEISKNIYFSFINNKDFVEVLATNLMETSGEITVSAFPCGTKLIIAETYRGENLIDLVYCLSKVNVSSGDLFLNQYADIIGLVSIVIETLSSHYEEFKKDMDSGEKDSYFKILKLIILGYISHKTKLKNNIDYCITLVNKKSLEGISTEITDEVGESEKCIVLFFQCQELETICDTPMANKIKEIQETIKKDSHAFSQLNDRQLHKIKETTSEHKCSILKTTFVFSD